MTKTRRPRGVFIEAMRRSLKTSYKYLREFVQQRRTQAANNGTFGQYWGEHDVVAPWTFTSVEARSLQSFIDDISRGESGRGRLGELDAVYLQHQGNLIDALKDGSGIPDCPIWANGIPYL